MIFEQLRTVNTRFAHLFLQPSQEAAVAEKVDIRAIRTETDKVLVDFFMRLNFVVRTTMSPIMRPKPWI